MHQIVVVSAGLSNPSSTRNLAEQIAGAAQTAVSARGEAADVSFVELRDIAVDLAQALTSFGYTTPALIDAQSKVTKADALIVVTPIFSASYSGLFKLFFDLLDNKALIDKPVLMAATAGTPRHSLALEHALRPLFSYLRARTVPTTIFAATEDFGSGEGAELGRRIDRGASELAAEIVRTSGVVGGLGGVTAEPAQSSERSSGSFSDLLKKYN